MENLTSPTASAAGRFFSLIPKMFHLPGSPIYTYALFGILIFLLFWWIWYNFIR